MWELIYYETAAGRSPVADFLDSLSAYEAERVIRKLDMLEQFGPRLGTPHVAPLRGRVWELRVTGKTHHRVLYAAIHGSRIIVLSAYTKKSRRAPKREIDTAERRLEDYIRRHAQ